LHILVCVKQVPDAEDVKMDQKTNTLDRSSAPATSYIISMGIKKVMEAGPVDLVFCGKQAIDGDTAQVGPGIACRLGMPQLTYVQEIESFDLKRGTVKVHRRIDNRYEVVESRLPCLMAVEKSINELSFSPLTGMIKAERYKPTIWSLKAFEANPDQLGLKGSPTSVRRIFPPPQRTGGKLLKGNTDQIVKTLVDELTGSAKKLAQKLIGPFCR
jgi:electron transfer flavoprotein beta subunit